MYANQKKHYQIVAVAVIVMILVALIGTTLVSAKSSHPPKDNDKKVTVPHQNPKQDGKPMDVSCHSRHARDAGVVCGEKEKDTRPLTATSAAQTATNKPAKIHAVYKVGDPKIYLPIITKP